MEKLLVHGGAELKGEINIGGSKNSALPILAATLLTPGKCIIRRVPDVSDTNYMVQILNRLGADVERASGTVSICIPEITTSEAPYDIVRKMRASVCVMGPLLARHKQAKVSLPGGCVIGDRPIDLHIRGLKALGATVDVSAGYVNLTVEKDLVGTEINLRGKFGSTVLGTGNIMMAACLAKGRTIIEGAATEPEVVDLACFLKAMGAVIEGEGTRRIEVEGVDELKGVEHTVIPDRIEAGTFLVAGALAGGSVTLRRTRPDHLGAVVDALTACGHEISATSDSITVRANPQPVGTRVSTGPYPAFPTDMQAQFTALLAMTPGISVVVDDIFPERFMHLPELNRMGAQIERQGNTAIIQGVEKLTGAPVMASDLRASAALVLAGLRAEGETEVNRLYHIDRGYEHIDEKLRALGAKMERVQI